MINRQEINEALSVLFTCVKSNSSFFLGLVYQKKKNKKNATTATSKQQEIEIVCLSMKCYRDLLSC